LRPLHCPLPALTALLTGTAQPKAPPAAELRDCRSFFDAASRLLPRPDGRSRFQAAGPEETGGKHRPQPRSSGKPAKGLFQYSEPVSEFFCFAAGRLPSTPQCRQTLRTIKAAGARLVLNLLPTAPKAGFKPSGRDTASPTRHRPLPGRVPACAPCSYARAALPAAGSDGTPYRHKHS